MKEFALPDLGEGVESGTVVRVLVAEGDTIRAEQGVVEVELDKATVEVPCPFAGRVAAVRVKAGDSVRPGDAILSVAAADGGTAPSAPAKAAPAAPAKAPAAAAPAKAAPAAPVKTTPAAPSAAAGTIPAGPAVRKLARHLGVDLTQVTGTGERGRITLEDVAARLAAGGGAGGPGPAPALPDFAQWGPVEREPLSAIRKRTAEAMARAWSLIPHVTHHDLADVTELEAGRKAFRQERPDVKLTMTAILLKASVVALKQFPDLNASLDLARGELVRKQHWHLGVAVDTEHGLLVPVVRDCDRKSVVELSGELDALAAKARARKLERDDMRGGTFTISNLGGIGGTGFTPIVNWPEVAILGVSRAREEYRPGPAGPVPRLLMPLSLSYDHRLIDGAMAARFVRFLADLLERPTSLLFRA